MQLLRCYALVAALELWWQSLADSAERRYCTRSCPSNDEVSLLQTTRGYVQRSAFEDDYDADGEAFDNAQHSRIAGAEDTESLGETREQRGLQDVKDAVEREEQELQRITARSRRQHSLPLQESEDPGDRDFELRSRARHQTQASRQKSEAQRAAQAMIERQEEREVSEAVNLASERVRQAQTRARAEMKRERLNAYQDLMQAEDATASLLSVDGRISPDWSAELYMGGPSPPTPAAAVATPPAPPTTMVAPAASDDTNVNGGTCGGALMLKCSRWNKMTTMNYTMEKEMGMIVWASSEAGWLLMISLGAYNTNGVACATIIIFGVAIAAAAPLAVAYGL